MALKHKNVHLAIMGMRIKTAFGFAHTPVRTAKMKETDESVADGAGKRSLHHCWGCDWDSLYGINVEKPKTLTADLPYDHS